MSILHLHIRKVLLHLTSGWMPKGRLIGGSPLEVGLLSICHPKGGDNELYYFQGKPMTVSVEGPLRGLFLCKLPTNSTVHVINDGDSILHQPFGKEAKTVTTSERSRYVFFQSSGRFYIEKRG